MKGSEMNRFCLMMAVILGMPLGGLAQENTPWGDPDLQGIWSNATITRLERPAELAGKEFFTEAEAAEYERDYLERNNMDRRTGTPEADVSRAYNDFWWDRGTRIVKTLRTSLITDPPDGRIPPLTAQAQRLAAERAEERRLHGFDGPENRPLGDRCILWRSTGPPILPTAYNNNYQILQSPGYVTIFAELMHAVRIIPLDGRRRLPEKVRQWMGDSRGRWEGDTLVVETTNFTDRTNFRNSGDQLFVTERFTREDPDTLMYEFMIEDEATFTKPWTAEIPMVKIEGPIYEYACQEGNYSLENVLAGARAEERKASGNQ